MKTSPCMNQVGLKSNDMCLYKIIAEGYLSQTGEETQTHRGDSHVKMMAEIGVVCLQAKMAPAIRSEERRGTGPSPEPLQRVGPPEL